MKETNDIEKYILNKVLMSAIVNCLEAGLISKDDSIEKIKEIIYSKKVLDPDNLFIQITYVDSLKSSIELLLSHNAYDEAIILAMTCVEHMLNYFYGEYFERIVAMSNRKIDDLLKGTKVSEKIGALYLLTFRESFPQQLESDILALNKKRNDFIHYKTPKIAIDEWDVKSKKDDETVKIASSALDLIEKLKAFLSNKEDEIYDSNQIAQEIFERLKVEEQNNGK